MINRQRIKFDSYGRVGDFNKKYASRIADISEYAVEKTAFDAAVKAIGIAAGLQQESSGAITNNANSLLEAMANVINKYTLRAMVKAKQLGNVKLATQLDEHVSFILFTTKQASVERALNLRALLNDNMATLTNITTANITEIDDAIDAYDGAKDSAIEKRQNKKASGTNLLPAAFKAASAAMANMYGLMFSYYNDTEPEMVAELLLAMKQIHTGIRHTIVDFTVMDENKNPIAAATITDTSNGKIFVTDAEGLGHIARHKAGHFIFIISAPGYHSVNFGVDVKRGKLNSYMVGMVKE
jgi:hypothetical protein